MMDRVRQGADAASQNRISARKVIEAAASGADFKSVLAGALKSVSAATTASSSPGIAMQAGCGP